MIFNQPKSALSKLIFSALIAVYILIFIGSMVRATGSGMGCPDWPFCFGQLIPPTSVEQLPANFQTLYPYYQNLEFNAFHTWMEYFNRLSGVLVGFFILLASIFAVKARKSHPKTFIAMMVALFSTLFQGWLGSVVVGSHLSPLIISLHMMLAQFITLSLIYAYLHSYQFTKIELGKTENWLLILSLIALLIQMGFGLITRSAIDEITNANLLERSEWMMNLPISFDIHRSFSIAVLVLFSFALIRSLKFMKESQYSNDVFNPDYNRVKLISILALLLLFCLFLVGLSLTRFDFPFWLQPIHLSLASILLGLCFALMMTTSGLKNST